MLKLSKNLKFISVTAWIIFSRSYDAYCTHTLTPDLSKEANPLVTVGGVSSWTVLIVILSILTAFAVFSYCTRTYKPMNLFPEEKGYSFSHFVGYLFLGKKEPWTSTLFKYPSDMKRLNNYMGVILTRCLVFAGIVSTTMWIFIHNSEYYRSVHSAPVVHTILIAGCLGIVYQWNKTEYKLYVQINQ